MNHPDHWTLANGAGPWTVLCTPQWTESVHERRSPCFFGVVVVDASENPVKDKEKPMPNAFPHLLVECLPFEHATTCSFHLVPVEPQVFLVCFAKDLDDPLDRVRSLRFTSPHALPTKGRRELVHLRRPALSARRLEQRAAFDGAERRMRNSLVLGSCW